jgi:hypothetical protein
VRVLFLCVSQLSNSFVQRKLIDAFVRHETRGGVSWRFVRHETRFRVYPSSPTVVQLALIDAFVCL